MKIDADFLGFDEFVRQAKDEIKQGMVEVAHEGVDYSKDTGNYQNHTHNLRSAPGVATVLDGEIVDMYVPSEPGHEKAKEKTENLLIYGKRPKNGIILADGMEYASFVESKGYKVISQGATHIAEKAKQQFKK